MGDKYLIKQNTHVYSTYTLQIVRELIKKMFLNRLRNYIKSARNMNDLKTIHEWFRITIINRE